MMTGIRNILWLLPLLLVISWPLWGQLAISFLSPDESFENLGKSAVPPPKNFSMEGVVFLQDKLGQKDWRIIAQRLYTDGGESKLQMEKIIALLFDQQEGRFHITSDSGLYDSKKQVLTLKENVQVKTAEGYEIKSPSLQYHENSQRIETDSAVQIKGKDIQIKGQGLMYNMQSGAYRIDGPLQFEAR